MDNRYAQLNKLRDPLIELNRVIEWALFRAPLSVLSEEPRKSAAERKQIDRGCCSSSKWGSIAKLRDITQLRELGVLKKSPGGGRSTGYELLASSVNSL